MDPVTIALLVALAQGAPPAPDTGSVVTPSDSVSLSAPLAALARADTTRPRRRAVEVSDGYALRLRVHRYASYTMVPLFATQMIAGNQLYQSGGSTPEWASTLHRVGAGGLGALFGINTVTGVWNAWETRGVAQGRHRRLLHGGLMLLSDAGFAYAGIKLGPEATRSAEKRREHRQLARLSMTTALLGYAVMLVGDR